MIWRQLFVNKFFCRCGFGRRLRRRWRERCWSWRDRCWGERCWSWRDRCWGERSFSSRRRSFSASLRWRWCRRQNWCGARSRFWICGGRSAIVLRHWCGFRRGPVKENPSNTDKTCNNQGDRHQPQNQPNLAVAFPRRHPCRRCSRSRRRLRPVSRHHRHRRPGARRRCTKRLPVQQRQPLIHTRRAILSFYSHPPHHCGTDCRTYLRLQVAG